MRRNTILTMLVVTVLALVAAQSARADEWQWPDKLNIAGFDIKDVQGTVRDDGSGSATGALALGPAGDQKVSLERSSKGKITGSISLNSEAAGVDLQADLSLTDKGLDGKGTIRSATKPIVNAKLSITSEGEVSGTGKVMLGGISAPVTFTIGRSFDVSGSAKAEKQVDTPLALYTFDGTLDLKGESGKVLATANGEVQRTGKLANQVSSQKVSDVQVDMSDGEAVISVSGVNVTFKFF
ncbi:MAG: hypothetical protein ABFD49_00200 [Armatimonadota bacterium]|nr:hypothetical protein [bacterium]